MDALEQWFDETTYLEFENYCILDYPDIPQPKNNFVFILSVFVIINIIVFLLYIFGK